MKKLTQTVEQIVQVLWSINQVAMSKTSYSEQSIECLTERYFEGSNSNVVSFLVDKKQMSIEDLELSLKEKKLSLFACLK